MRKKKVFVGIIVAFYWLELFVVEMQVIAINKQFPGPVVNVTTNWNVVINVRNSLDEPLLLTWYAWFGRLAFIRFQWLFDVCRHVFYLSLS